MVLVRSLRHWIQTLSTTSFNVFDFLKGFGAIRYLRQGQAMSWRDKDRSQNQQSPPPVLREAQRLPKPERETGKPEPPPRSVTFPRFSTTCQRRLEPRGAHGGVVNVATIGHFGNDLVLLRV